MIGPISFAPGGEWAKPRIICLQFQGITGGGMEQFTDWSRQVVVYPNEYASGKLIYPFENASK